MGPRPLTFKIPPTYIFILSCHKDPVKKLAMISIVSITGRIRWRLVQQYYGNCTHIAMRSVFVTK